MSEGREINGRYAKGHSGGPGRPLRAVETDYLRRLADNVSLTDWTVIVRRAVEDAMTGDRHARDWLAKYLVGTEPTTLINLAVLESRGETVEHEIGAVVRDKERYEALRERLDSFGS